MHIKILCVIGVILTFLGILCTLYPSASFGVFFFTTLGIGILGLTFCKKMSLINTKYKKIFKIISLFGEIIFGVWFVSFVVIELLIFNGTTSDDEVVFDTLIILGAGIIQDNPSTSFKARLDTAILYLNENQDTIVITTGGYGENEEFSEAYVAYKYLTDNGISSDRIFCEEKSTNTYENILYAKEILGEDYTGNTSAVSNDFHLFRARQLLKLNDFTPYAIGSKIPNYTALNALYSIREYFSVVKHLLFER